MKLDIMEIIDIAEEAGGAIMAVYGKADFGVRQKDDRSPLTEADMASHDVIVRRLRSIDPGCPVLSEEARTVPYAERRLWTSYWLVDPLDGTKEFIRRNGEFTVNIALIAGREPVAGVVHAPARETTYYAMKGEGAFRRERGAAAERIGVTGIEGGILKIVGSRSHGGGRLAELVGRLGNVEFVSMGSSLKLCLVAEGSADLYPRLGPTMEWDTAAAQCVVEEAGGVVLDMNGARLAYNKEDLRNPEFVAAASQAIAQEIA